MPEVTQKCNFHHLQKSALLLIGRNHDAICKQQSSYKVYLNTISDRELSDPLCDSVNKGQTLDRLHLINCHLKIVIK